VKIPKPLAEAMFAHAQEAYPKECCGQLAGTHGVPTHIYCMQNVHETPEVFFEMFRQEQAFVQKNIRHNELDLVAIYHSHPKSPARPSASDIRLAYPEPFYLLISLQHRDAPELRAYRIVEGVVTEEPIDIV
jgi:proteasome lid subunit RPN8/RPN11